MLGLCGSRVESNSTLQRRMTIHQTYSSGLLLATLLLTLGCGGADSPAQTPLIDLPNAQDIVELDLGRFDLTISQESTNSSILLDLHVFAKVRRYKEPEVKQILQENQNQFRHTVILKIRGLDRPTLNDPGLTVLRETIKQSIMELGSEMRVEGIGFYQFRFLEE